MGRAGACPAGDGLSGKQVRPRCQNTLSLDPRDHSHGPAIDRFRLFAGDRFDLGVVPGCDRQPRRAADRFRRLDRLHRLVHERKHRKAGHRQMGCAQPVSGLSRWPYGLCPRQLQVEGLAAAGVPAGRRPCGDVSAPARGLPLGLAAPPEAAPPTHPPLPGARRAWFVGARDKPAGRTGLNDQAPDPGLRQVPPRPAPRAGCGAAPRRR
jgi:hypothetical protein